MIERLCQALARVTAISRTMLTDGVSEAQQEAALAAAEQVLAEFEFRYCRVCGCSEHDACEGGCSWAGADLCSECAERK